MTTPTLLPCPFCGGRAKITTVRRGNYRREGDNHQGLCNRCKARGPLIQDSEQAAADAWNAQSLVAAEQMRTALRFYADVANWRAPLPGMDSPVAQDGGVKAIAALQDTRNRQ